MKNVVWKNRPAPSLILEKWGLNFDNLINIAKKFNYFQLIFANKSAAKKISEYFLGIR